MSLIIQYCETCGERVPPGHIESGEALLFRNGCYCVGCKDDVLTAHPELAQLGPPAVESRHSPGPVKRAGTGKRATMEAREGHRPATVNRQGRAGTGRRPSGNGYRNETSRRTKGADMNKLAVPIAIGGLIVAIIVGAVIATSGGGDDPSVDDAVTDVQPPPDRAKTPPNNRTTEEPDEVEPPPDPLAGDVRRAQRQLKDRNEDYNSNLEMLERMAARAKGNKKWENTIADMILAVEHKRDADANRIMTQLDQKADELVEAQRFMEASDVYDEISDELVTGSLTSRIAMRRKAIDAKRVAHEKRIADEAKKVTNGTPPTGGEAITVFDGDGLEGWGVKGSGITRTSGTLSVQSPGAKTFTFRFRGKGDARTYLKDFYVTCDFRVITGRFTAALRLPWNTTDGTPGLVQLTSTPTCDLSEWSTLHATVKGSQGQFWVQDKLSVTQMKPFSCKEGAMCFWAGPGDYYEVKNVRILAFNQGGPVPKKSAQPVKPPDPGKIGEEIKIFNGKDLSNWEGRSFNTWTVAEGVITAPASTTAHAQIRQGDKTLKNYRLTFEVRRVTGTVQVLVRWGDDRKANSFGLNEKLFKDPEVWSKFIVTVKDATVNIAWGTRSQNAAAARDVGNVGFALPKGSSCQLRGLKLEKLK